jgi:hypothetical protein
MQHKRQLGGSRYIFRVRVFRSESFGPYPYLLFYVAGPGAAAFDRDDSTVSVKAQARPRL